MLKTIMHESLVWLPEKGIGYYPVNSDVYDAAYFERYCKMSLGPMGMGLTEARVNLVHKHFDGNLLDVGIGSGQFIEALPGAMGYDVNPDAVKWLRYRNLYADPYAGRSFQCMTFWDSLEHIEDPRKILKYANKWVFVSMPIYNDLAHLLSSKHFRKDEHFWYFTGRGLIMWFKTQGFELVDGNHMETELGREDIETFVFRRVAA